MINEQTMSDLATGKRPSWIFMHQGKVQLYGKGKQTGLLVATSREAAEKLQAKMAEMYGRKVSIAEVGTVEGETLAMQLAVAVLNHGAKGAMVSEDGERCFFFQAPAP
jgi:hypothetical protein